MIAWGFVGIRIVLPARLKLPVPGSDHQDFTTDFLLSQSYLWGVALPFLVIWLKFISIWMILYYHFACFCLCLGLSRKRGRMYGRRMARHTTSAVNRGSPVSDIFSKSLNKRPRHWRFCHLQKHFPQQSTAFSWGYLKSDLQEQAGAEHQSVWMSKSKILHRTSQSF